MNKMINKVSNVGKAIESAFFGIVDWSDEFHTIDNYEAHYKKALNAPEPKKGTLAHVDWGLEQQELAKKSRPIHYKLADMKAEYTLKCTQNGWFVFLPDDLMLCAQSRKIIPQTQKDGENFIDNTTNKNYSFSSSQYAKVALYQALTK